MSLVLSSIVKDVYEKNHIVDSIRVDDWTAELTIIDSRLMKWIYYRLHAIVCNVKKSPTCIDQILEHLQTRYKSHRYIYSTMIPF